MVYITEACGYLCEALHRCEQIFCDDPRLAWILTIYHYQYCLLLLLIDVPEAVERVDEPSDLMMLSPVRTPSRLRVRLLHYVDQHDALL